MKAQWWLIGVVTAIAVGGAGCGQVAAVSHNQPARSRDNAVLTAAPRVRVRIINGIDPQQPAMRIKRRARRRAVTASVRMVTSAILPKGAREVARLHDKYLREPGEVSACDPIVDATTLWRVRKSAGKLEHFLIHHVPRGMTNDGTGSTSSGGVTTSYLVSDVPSGKQAAERTLLFTFARVGRATELRVDGLTIPSGAVCMSGGGGDAAPSASS